MPTAKQQLGARGEAASEAHLLRQGYRLLHRNYRCAYGELDRIMMDGETLVFIEVKTRRGETHGSPAESVTQHKRRQITRAAAHYLTEEGEDRPCRFDVVEVSLLNGERPAIRHLVGMFESEPWEESD